MRSQEIRGNRTELGRFKQRLCALCWQLVRDHSDAVLCRVRPDLGRRLQIGRAPQPDPVRRQTHVRMLLRLYGDRAYQHADRHVVAGLRNHFGRSN